MAWTVAVMAAKGGVGKSTVARNLAAALANLGYKVLVIDGDPPQHAVWDWMQTRLGRGIEIQNGGELTVIKSEHPALEKFDKDAYQVVFFDLPGRLDGQGPLDEEVRHCLTVADLVLTPLRATKADWRLFGSVVKTVEKLKLSKIRPSAPPVWVILNQFKAYQEEDVSHVPQELPAGFTLLSTRLRDLRAWDQADRFGLAPTELKRPGLAGSDLRDLTREVLEGLNRLANPKTKARTKGAQHGR